MKTLAKACKPRDSIFDKARRDTVLDLSDLTQDRIDAAAFFGESHTTEGMRILLKSFSFALFVSACESFIRRSGCGRAGL
jgi:hypothetical protein